MIKSWTAFFMSTASTMPPQVYLYRYAHIAFKIFKVAFVCFQRNLNNSEQTRHNIVRQPGAFFTKFDGSPPRTPPLWKNESLRKGHSVHAKAFHCVSRHPNIQKSSHTKSKYPEIHTYKNPKIQTSRHLETRISRNPTNKHKQSRNQSIRTCRPPKN